MRQHGSEISRGDPCASILSRNRARPCATTIGSRVAPTSAMLVLVAGERAIPRLTVARSRPRRSVLFDTLSQVESTRVKSSLVVHLPVRLRTWSDGYRSIGGSTPRVKRSFAKFRRRQSCTILSWPGEGVKFRPGAP